MTLTLHLKTSTFCNQKDKKNHSKTLQEIVAFFFFGEISPEKQAELPTFLANKSANFSKSR
jgi:hypothetical protein